MGESHTVFVNNTERMIEIQYYQRHILKPGSSISVSWDTYDRKETLLPSLRLTGVRLNECLSLNDLYENRAIIIFRCIDGAYTFRPWTSDISGLKIILKLETMKRRRSLVVESAEETLRRMTLLLKKVKIRYNQCEHLVKKFRGGVNALMQELDVVLNEMDSQLLIWLKPAVMRYICSKFMSSMLEGETLLLLCSQDEDHPKAVFALLSPRSPSVAAFSEFALVLRELDWTLDFIWFVCHQNSGSFEDWEWCKHSLRLVYPSGSQYLPNENLIADVSRQTDDLKHFETSLAPLEPATNISLASAITSSFFFPTSYLPTAWNKNENENESKLKAIWKKRLEFKSASSSTSAPNPEDISGYFEIGYADASTVGPIGSGSFKSVNKCNWLGQTVAVSVFKDVSEDAVRDEASLLARVQYPNVVEFLGFAYKADDHRPEVFLVTELMDQDLDSLIVSKLRSHESGKSSSNRPPFEFLVAVDIALQIVEAVIHLHECGVMHRDLKPGNCMTRPKYRKSSSDPPAFKNIPDYYTVKLIDFGASKLRGEDSYFHTGRRGTPSYMAPEVWAGIGSGYTWSADVYSFGVTCYEIFTGRLPFKRGIRYDEVQKIMRANPSFPFPLPILLEELIRRCWAQNASDRPKFQVIREALWRLKLRGSVLEVAGSNLFSELLT